MNKMNTSDIDQLKSFLKEDSTHGWWNRADLRAFEWNRTFGIYADAYLKAASCLVNQVNETKRDQDYLIFPIFFLYRHYFELRLKEIIKDGKNLLDEGNDYPSHHDLTKLWAVARTLTLKIWPEGPREELKIIDESIEIFSKMDRQSFAFRYPENKKGEIELADFGYVNLQSLKDKLEPVITLLDGISTGVSEYLEAKDEMKKIEFEMMKEMESYY